MNRRSLLRAALGLFSLGAIPARWGKAAASVPAIRWERFEIPPGLYPLGWPSHSARHGDMRAWVRPWPPYGRADYGVQRVIEETTVREGREVRLVTLIDVDFGVADDIDAAKRRAESAMLARTPS